MNKLYITLLALVCWTSSVLAVVLEELPVDQLHQMLAEKKVGYYIGSFDPIHKGHEQVVSKVLDHNFVDYVIIFPSWGGDQYKSRIDVQIRLEMLFSLYKNHPTVLVTKLPPIEFQKLLTVDSPSMVAGKPAVHSAIIGTSYIGIVGSDVVLEKIDEPAERTQWLEEFMAGIKIPEPFYTNTIGGIIALPVTEFIVALRAGDDLAVLNNMLGTRPIIEVFAADFQGISSTKVRNKIKHGEDPGKMLSPQIVEIINKHQLYK